MLFDKKNLMWIFKKPKYHTIQPDFFLTTWDVAKCYNL